MPSHLHAVGTAPATFEDWWQLFPSDLRQKKAVCEQKWKFITGEGLDTTTLDKDSGTYVPLFVKATPEEIIDGTRKWREQLKRQDFGFHPDIRYEPRAPQFLNQARWRDYE